MIEDYDIIEKPSETALVEAVKAMIKKGWQPHGSLSVTPTVSESWYYTQAMVKIGCDHECRETGAGKIVCNKCGKDLG